MEVNTIYSKFHNLTLEKQKEIVNAAMKEFAENGFEKASTNGIIKVANISKGSLFNYFRNKKGLYLYLVDYAIDIVEREYLNLVDVSIHDFFARLHNIAMIKMEFLQNYPNTMHFLSTVFLNDEFIDEKILKKIHDLQLIRDRIMYENINLTLFRDGIDPKKAIQIIRWTFDGYELDMRAQLKNKDFRKLDFDQYWDEFYEYIEVMKKSFYK